MSENTTEYSNKHHQHHHHHHDCGCPQNPVQEDAMLDVKGLKYMLGKLCDKILLAVGVIHAHGELPLHLWREYEKHGVVVKGKIDEVTEEQDGYLTKEDYQKFLEALEEITKLWAEINDNINPAIKDLQDIVNTQGGQINNINSKITTINSEISVINKTLEELQSTVSRQGVDIDTINSTLASLSESVTSIQDALTSIQDSALTSVSASGTAPIWLSAIKSGTSVSITGSISAASQSADGTMSATDKTRLDNLYSAYRNGELGGMSEEQEKELTELWEKYQNGTLEGGTLTNLTMEGSGVSVDATLKVVVGTVSGAGNVVRLSGTPKDGHELHVMLQAVADSTTVRTSTTYTATDGQATTTFSLSNGDWIEYNFIYVGGTYYVRAAASNQ